MDLYMIKVRRAFKGWIVPVQVLQPFVNQWIPITDRSEVAFEVPMIHWVKADDGRIQTDVRLS